MKGLDDEERSVLESVMSEPECDDMSDSRNAAEDRLVARGLLLKKLLPEDDEFTYELDPTPMGILILAAVKGQPA